jgi:predicted phosphodiesterase
MPYYDFTEYKDVLFVGDIHGEFNPLVWDAGTRKGVKDALIVVCGDIGMGFYKPTYYRDTFKSMDKKLKERNIALAMFRGNHDDPLYFKGAAKESLSVFDAIHLIEDYSVLGTCIGDVLCIGGARSIDRVSRILDVSWWFGENVQPMPDGFLDELAKDGRNVRVVCSHAAPSIALPNDIDIPPDSQLYQWGLRDATLLEDNRNEREYLTKILQDLKDAGQPVEYWIYGHYHECFYKEHDGVKFIGLDMLRSYPLRKGENVRVYSDWFRPGEENKNITN